ncbi:MAG TPA: EI24 domain-containing protein [Rhizomicrobium sp.]|nr:EI24 domain-containing protein [Rhizomicrobium sp.]
MFASLGRALASFFDPTLIGTMLKALFLTILLFVALLAGLEYLLQMLPTLGAPWVNRVLEILAPVLAIIGLFTVGGPVAALFASLYLDRVADAIEARSYAAEPKAPGASWSTSLGAGIRLAGLVILVDLLLLPADALLPGAGELMTLVANGFLLGREYFELAALRHLQRGAADALRKRNAGRIFAAGMIISAFTFVPLVNFIAPLFGAALMVHLYKRLARESAT